MQPLPLRNYKWTLSAFVLASTPEGIGKAAMDAVAAMVATKPKVVQKYSPY